MHKEFNTTATIDVLQIYGTNYSMELGFLVASFLVPAFLMLLPLIALVMQVSSDTRAQGAGNNEANALT